MKKACFPIALLSIALVACQGATLPTMSLEQARKLAVDLSGAESGVPPRAPSDLDSMPESLDDLGGPHFPIDVMLSSDEDMRELEDIYRERPDEWGWFGWRFRNNARDQFEKGAVTRAFFYAGTRALLVSNWPVERTSAKTLTTDLVRRQATDPDLSRAEALRQAMVAMIDGPGFLDDSGDPVYSYAHPLFWAPFTLIGDGGGGAAPDA